MLSLQIWKLNKAPYNNTHRSSRLVDKPEIIFILHRSWWQWVNKLHSWMTCFQLGWGNTMGTLTNPCFSDIRSRQDAMKNWGSADLSIVNLGAIAESNLDAIPRRKYLPHLVALTVGRLSQIQRQATPVRTLELFKCFVSETSTQDLNSIITLPSPDATSSSRFTLRVSGDPVFSARVQTDVGIALTVRAKHTKLYWIQVNRIVCCLAGLFCTCQ